MRVTNNLIYGQSGNAIANANERLSTIQDKIDKQTNITKASDDPVGAREVLQYGVSNNKLQQYDKAIKTATGSLEYEDITLDSLNDALDKAKTLFIQGQSDVNMQTDINAIGEQLSVIVESMADLMNSKSADGSYIFAGTNSQAPAFVIGSDGRYQWKGNEGQKFVQISDNMKVPITDSGKPLFQSVWTHHTLDAKARNSNAPLSTTIKSQGDFDRFMSKYYNPVDASKNNFTLTTRPFSSNGVNNPAESSSNTSSKNASSATEQEKSSGYFGKLGEYVVTDSKGREMASGTYHAGRPIIFAGVSFVLRGPPGNTVDISLVPPKKDNVLNQITDSLNVLMDKNSSDDARQAAFSNATTSINNTQKNIGEAQSMLGARLNMLTNREDFGSAHQLSNSTAQQKVAGLDVASAASKLSMAETALTSSQKLFTRINNLSLFNKM